MAVDAKGRDVACGQKSRQSSSKVEAAARELGARLRDLRESGESAWTKDRMTDDDEK